MAIKISRTFLAAKTASIDRHRAARRVFFRAYVYELEGDERSEEFLTMHVADIHHIPYLLFVEIFGIFLPLLFHSVYGIFISAEARPNVGNYGYGRNWFYIFQRVTGIFLFFFLLFHILNLRFGLIPGLESYGNPVAGNADQAFAIVAAEFQNIAYFDFLYSRRGGDGVASGLRILAVRG